MIISMAWVGEAYVSGRKTRTRRKWVDAYAKRFKVGDFFQVYNKSPRMKGRKIGESQVLGIKQEHISLMPDEDFEKEGFAYMEEEGLKIWGKEPRQAFEDWRRMDETYYIVDFTRFSEVLKNNGDGG